MMVLVMHNEQPGHYYAWFKHHPRRLWTWKNPGGNIKNQIDYDLMYISHSVDLILKLVGILLNRTSVEVVDKLSSTAVDCIRSERELETCAYMEPKMLNEHAQRHAGKCER